jgi:hypothetical protein
MPLASLLSTTRLRTVYSFPSLRLVSALALLVPPQAQANAKSANRLDPLLFQPSALAFDSHSSLPVNHRTHVIHSPLHTPYTPGPVHIVGEGRDLG